MRKSLLILGGTIVVLVLVAVWLYLLFFGTPKNIEEVFTSFNFTGSNVELSPQATSTENQDPYINIAGKQLRQLTTKPVAGYQEIKTSSSSPRMVYYMEAGTGHIFSINLKDGNERRVSGTTIAGAFRAEFSSDGRFVAIQSGEGSGKKTSVGEISTTSESLSIFNLNDLVHDFKMTEKNELLFTVRNNVTVGKVLTLTNRTERTIFTVPFRESLMVWGNTAEGPHYTYPKPTYFLDGYLYKIQNGSLSRLPLEGFGFTAVGNSSLIGVGMVEKDRYTSYIYDTKTKQRLPGLVTMLPEKCVFSNQNTSSFWCASDQSEQGYGFPDSWYVGDLSFRDSIFAVEVNDKFTSLTNLVDTFKETGREIDVTGMKIGPNDERLYFTNKNDNTLWLYDLAF